MAGPLCAATPSASLVLDINPRQQDEYQTSMGVSGPLLPAGRRFFFAGNEPGTGTEPWVSDGTAEGTELVRDACLGECSSRLEFLAALPGGAMVFRTEETDFGRTPEIALWASDGTRAGTVLLTSSARGGPAACSSESSSLAIGPLVYFTSQIDFYCGLWVTDGTAAGTRPLREGAPTFRVPWSFVSLGGKLYFFAQGDTTSALWRSDGTPEGTVQVRSFPELPFTPEPGFLVVAGSRLFFVQPGNGGFLWSSDGTAAGTRPVVQLSSAAALDGAFLKAFGSTDYFVTSDPASGRELWVSDGTPSGTKKLTAFERSDPSLFGIVQAGSRIVFTVGNPGARAQLWSTGGTPQTTGPLAGCPEGCPDLPDDPQLVSAGHRVLFTGHDSRHGFELWSTDGTGAGTRRVLDLCRGSCDSFPWGYVAARGKAFFLARSAESLGLWQSDGTAPGTTLLAQLPYGSEDSLLPNSLLNLAVLGEKVYFPARTGSYRRQLWESDGTPAGTGPLTLFGGTGAGSDPGLIARVGTGVLFRACDGVSQSLWRSDGTPAGTASLTPAEEDACGSTSALTDLRVLGGIAFFRKQGDDGLQLWRTDGMDAGTYPLPPFGLVRVGDTAVFGNRLVFLAFSEAGEVAFWESDGTIPGTRKLFGLPPDIVYAAALNPLGAQLFFMAGPGFASSNAQLWVTDGTAAGTRQLMFLSTSPFDDPTSPLVAAGVYVYFVACPRAMCELWKTDGTAAGTAPVLPNSSDKFPQDLAEFQGALYFTDYVGPDSLRGLFRTDGTPAGTVLLGTFGIQHTVDPVFMTPMGGQLFFAIDDQEHGRELWRTDGTPGGTVLVRDIAPGPASSRPSSLLAAGGQLFFSASDGDHGFELWESDGTEQGTRMVQDLAPGGVSSSPSELTLAGNRIFFSADDGITGREPWIYPLGPHPSACLPSATALCLGGGRFRVDAVWRDFAGNSGTGQAQALTADTGYFWFFDPANVEVVLKALDGRGVNGHWWVFYGALSNVEYTLTVTDMETGATRRYVNPPGRLGSVGDTRAFGPLGATGSDLSFGPEPELFAASAAVASTTGAAAPCVASAARLCLSGGRFAVEARWRDFSGGNGTGTAVSLSGDTGYFWFFGPENIEVVLKVLDGRPVNGKFWVFYGALSSVEYTLTVTDTETGAVKTYTNPSGRLASRADTGAF